MHGVYLLSVLLNLLKLFPFARSLATQHAALPFAEQNRGFPNSIVRKALPQVSPAVAADRAIFRIPRSDMILALEPKAGVSQEGLSAVLLTADSWVTRKISIFGNDGSAGFIFQHGTGERPYTRLIVWSTPDKDMTWGEIKILIDGLWTYLIDMKNFEDTYWEIYEDKVDQRSQLGWGAIVETEQPPGVVIPGHANSSSTSKRALGIASAPPSSNTSATLSV